jgi:serine/threonine-protein kinase
MRVKIECKNAECRQHLSAPEELFGKTVKCPRCGTMNRVPHKEEKTDLPYEQLGSYRLVRRLGQGAMGTVYEAVDEKLGRRVALKVLLSRLTDSPAFLARFEREARAAANLNHPNIVTVYDVGEDEGRHFFSMEFVDGESLFERLEREEKIPLQEALDVLIKVAKALKYAWEHGRMIHRDVKPDNVLLSKDGHVKLADLGLAKSAKDQTGLTTSGEGFGSPAYMAPEQAKEARDVDCRADIYSLGISLFHAVTGRPPFIGNTMLTVVLAHESKPLPDPRKLNPDLPESLFDVLRRMCAKDPADRYQDYDELLDDLGALGRGEAPKHAVLTPVAIEDGEATELEEPAPEERPEAQAEAPGAKQEKKEEKKKKDPESDERTVAAAPPAEAKPRKEPATKESRKAVTEKAPASKKPAEPPPAPAKAKPPSKRKWVLPAIAACLALVAGLFFVVRPGGSAKTEGESSDLEDMFVYVQKYAQEHPANYQEIIARLGKIKERGVGTEYEFKAEDEADAWRRKWEAAGQEEFENRLKTAADLALAGKMAEARKVWDEFPAPLQTDPIKKRIESEVLALTQLAKAPAPETEPETKPVPDVKQEKPEEEKPTEEPELGKPPAEEKPEEGKKEEEPAEAPKPEEGAAKPAETADANAEFDARLRVFADIEASVGAILKKHNYEHAATVARFRATSPDYKAFKDDLLAMKGDFDAIDKLYGRFLDAMNQSVDEVVVLGAQQGKVLGVKDGKILLEQEGKTIPVLPSDVPTSFVSRKLGGSDETPAEQWYALGVLFLHEGYDAQAREAFKRVGEGSPGVDRQLRWLKWHREAQASATLKQLKDAGGAGEVRKIPALAGALLQDYGDTQVVTRELEAVKKMKEEAERTVEDRKKAIETGLALLEQAANASREAATAEYEKAKKDTEDKCQKELDALKKKLEDNAASMKKATDINTQKKLKKEEKDTNEKIAQANKKYSGLAGKVQDAYKKRKESIRVTEVRLSRKVKGGQTLSEEDLKKEFNLKEVPPAEEGDTRAEEEKPEKGKEKPAPAEAKTGTDKT